MAMTLKSKLGGLWAATNAVRLLADEGYLDDDLRPTGDLETINSFLDEELGGRYESDEALENDLRLVRGILENGEY